MNDIQLFCNKYGALLAQGTIDSIVMTGIATLIASVIGLILGVLLVVCAPGGLKSNRVVYTVVGWIVTVSYTHLRALSLIHISEPTRLL